METGVANMTTTAVAPTETSYAVATTAAPLELEGPGLGETQRRVLVELKRRGIATLAEIRAQVRFTAATLREHLEALASRGLVQRRGTRALKRGRPEVLYALSARGERLFPNGEGDVLADLVQFISAEGQAPLLERFCSTRAARRRDALLDRVRGLAGPARLAEVARVLSEQGFMAEVGTAPDGAATLRLCHCPVKEFAQATPAACRHEVRLLEQLVGVPLERTEYALDGDNACTYVVRGAAPRLTATRES